ncbi:hypothetical protein BH20ACT6_BH20ACT6_17400 [soil metagenome]
MFRRRSESAPASETSEETLRRLEDEGKGRPTPSRRDAEAARKARLKPPRTRKEIAKRERQRRTEQRNLVRSSMAAGDEKHLPARDQGPVRRFARDFVDARRNVAQYLLPLLMVILLLSFIPRLLQIQALVWAMTIALTTVDTMWLYWSFRREVRRRFEPSQIKGATGYALLRSSQMRRLRLPKPQVKYGEKLPERY